MAAFYERHPQHLQKKLRDQKLRHRIARGLSTDLSIDLRPSRDRSVARYVAACTELIAAGQIPSFSQVAEHVGVSRQAVERQFASRDAMYAACGYRLALMPCHEQMDIAS